MKIDIATRSIPNDHGVFVLHPGESKKFYTAFQDQHLAFLDLPGAAFPNDLELGDDEITAEILVSQAVSKWHRGGKDEANPPSRDREDYSDQVSKPRTRFLNEVKGFYSEAQPGDVIIAPGPGYVTPVLIGELVEDFKAKTFATTEQYPDEKIPARRVNWFPVEKIKAHFTTRLIELMQNRQALIEIRSVGERKEIYGLIYPEYTWRGEAVGRTLITQQKIDILEFSANTKLLVYFAALFAAQGDGQIRPFVKLGIDDAIRRYYSSALFTDTSIEISSPGRILLFSKHVALPAFIGVMLTLSGSDLNLSQAQKVEIANSGSLTKNDPCHVEVEKRVEGALDAMGKDLWQALCAEAEGARDKIGLESAMGAGAGKQVRPKPKPTK